MAKGSSRYAGIMGNGELCDLPSVHRLGLHIVNYIGAVLAGTSALFVCYIVVDLLKGRDVIDSLVIRGTCGLVVIAALGLWYRGKERQSWLLVDVSRLIIATTISLGTTIGGYRAGAPPGVAIAYGVMITLLGVLLLRSRWMAALIYLCVMVPPTSVLLIGPPPHVRFS